MQTRRYNYILRHNKRLNDCRISVFLKLEFGSFIYYVKGLSGWVPQNNKRNTYVGYCSKGTLDPKIAVRNI